MSRYRRSRVEGLKECNSALGQLPRHVGKATLVRFGKKRLEPMAASARENAPEDEGKLKRSIIVGTRQGSPGQRRKRFADKATVEVYMGPTADGYPQALPQEFGGPNNAPQGYMRKAWDEHSDQLLDGIAEDLSGQIAAAAKRVAKRRARKG
ncbi:HK97 gp10 family phage protein [Rhizorhabdus wittichii]|uniref:HK97 gp10 family phage protein n=1 Tax=Rhizorhabdus wittichii TaxID=160791 RepID=A0A975D2M7_9SPHN|nr:HK97 gp10 family phage protein [Rhizorhabdus wittichii]QTH21995.1 HK97 gp10 family phage protein [Rhizorhabdus wittichii]